MKKVIRTSLFLCFVFLGVTSKCQESKVIDGVVAVVGDKILMHSEVETEMNSLKAQGTIINDKVRCKVIEGFLLQKLLLHQAELDSVVVTEDQLEGEMDLRMNYFISQMGSEKQMEQYFKKSIVEIKEELRESVKDQLVVRMMQSTITSGINVTPKEVKKYYNGLSKDSLPLIASQVEMAQLVRYGKEGDAGKKEALDKLTNIRNRIINGEDFATLAVLYSEDEGSAKRSGELGFLGRAELVPEFSEVAFKLKNTEVSEIVETQYGYHIIQLIKRRGQKVNARHILIKHKIGQEEMQLVKLKMDSIYQLISMDSISFEQAALKYSDDEATAKSNGVIVNPQTGTTVFEVDQVDPQLFYVIDGMEPGDISKPIPMQSLDGKKGYRMVKLLRRTEPHKADLEKDYDVIKNKALFFKQESLMDNWKKNQLKRTYVKLSEDCASCSFESYWKQ